MRPERRAALAARARGARATRRRGLGEGRDERAGLHGRGVGDGAATRTVLETTVTLGMRVRCVAVACVPDLIIMAV